MGRQPAPIRNRNSGSTFWTGAWGLEANYDSSRAGTYPLHGALPHRQPGVLGALVAFVRLPWHCVVEKQRAAHHRIHVRLVQPVGHRRVVERCAPTAFNVIQIQLEIMMYDVEK